MRNRLVSRIVAAAVVLAGAACTRTVEEVGSIHVKSQHVRAAQGGSIAVTAQESPELAGTALTIPAAALATDTEITVGLQRTDIVPAEELAAGPVAVFGPSGTRFSTPATMELPYRLPEGQSAAGLFVLVLEDDGSSLRIEPPALVIDAAAGKVRFPVSGFTRFQPGAKQDLACRGVICQTGETCVDGRCVQVECVAEVCGDGGDDDCDGQIDEDCASGCSTDAGCSAGQVCSEGACAPIDPCAGVVCPTSEACANGACFPTDCADRACAPGEVCQSGECVANDCVGVTCAEGKVCANGECIAACSATEVCGNTQDDDCDGEVDEGCVVACANDAGCATGGVCVQGYCRPADPCAGVICGSGEACALGSCYPVDCPDRICGQGEVCVSAQCVPAGCAGVACASGEVCSNGQCVPACGGGETCGNGIDDDCDGEIDEGCAVSCGDSGVICATGEVCSDGRCTIGCATDADCPSGQVCDQGYCA